MAIREAKWFNTRKRACGARQQQRLPSSEDLRRELQAVVAQPKRPNGGDGLWRWWLDERESGL